MIKKNKKKKRTAKKLNGLKRKICQVVLIKILTGEGRDVIIDELIEDDVFAAEEQNKAALEFVNECCFFLPNEKMMASLLEPNLEDEVDVAEYLEKLYADYFKKMEKYFDYDSKKMKKSPEKYSQSIKEKIEENWDLPKELIQGLLKFEFEFDFKIEGEESKPSE